MSKKSNSTKSHLTLDDRIVIEKSLDIGFSFNEIAITIKKDPTTVSKEIKKHFSFIKRNAYGSIQTSERKEIKTNYSFLERGS